LGAIALRGGNTTAGFELHFDGVAESHEERVQILDGKRNGREPQDDAAS